MSLFRLGTAKSSCRSQVKVYGREYSGIQIFWKAA
jgi:hypothetical protein